MNTTAPSMNNSSSTPDTELIIPAMATFNKYNAHRNNVNIKKYTPITGTNISNSIAIMLAIIGIPIPIILYPTSQC